MQSFEDEILTENLKEPLDDLRDLDTDQLENLDAGKHYSWRNTRWWANWSPTTSSPKM